MSWFEVLTLSVIQGLTEFLPVSSSGHLVLFQSFFGFNEPPVTLDIMLHVGTLLAVFFYFKEELFQIMKGIASGQKNAWWIAGLIFIGTIPAVLVGFLFEDILTSSFGDLRINGWFFLLTAFLLFSTYFVKRSNNKQFKELNWKDALVVGIFQAISILPAVSRSGATIASALWRGASRETAFKFSFYLSIPAILGALALQFPKLLESRSNNLEQYFIGLIVAGVIGYFSLKLLEATLKSDKFYLFGFYCLFLGLIILLI